MTLVPSPISLLSGCLKKCQVVTFLMVVTKHLSKASYWKEGFLLGSQLKGTDVGREVMEAEA